MRLSTKFVTLWVQSVTLLLAMLLVATGTSTAAPVVPGTGERLLEVGDDFEDPQWTYDPNEPKGSQDVDGRTRSPGGRSRNGRWYEGPDRGQPDIVRRVQTPDGGLAGSEGALLFQSRYTGVPNVANRQRAQDDLFMNIDGRLGRYIPVSQSPNVVVRVYLPPFDEWEQRTGSAFGFRATVRGTKADEPNKTEPYWPGMFFNFSTGNRRQPGTAAWLVIRAREPGSDYRKFEITETGWWTLGMSFTPDGRIHYYARPGVDDLTAEDHLASHYPYTFRCRSFISVFFDVFSQNDGRNPSTAWIIDDPTVYVSNANMLARKPATRRAPTRRTTR